MNQTLERGQFFICDINSHRKERALNANSQETAVDFSPYQNHGLVYEPILTHVRRCEFYLNDRLVNIEVVKPYALPADRDGRLTRFNFPIGEYKLSVVVIDQSNQREEANLFFRVTANTQVPKPEAEITQALYLCDADLNRKLQKATPDFPLYWGDVSNPAFVYEPASLEVVHCDFFMNDTWIQRELQAPFALARDRDGDLLSASSLLSAYPGISTLKVVAYTKAGQQESLVVRLSSQSSTAPDPDEGTADCAPMQGIKISGVQFNPSPNMSLQMGGRLQFIYDDGRVETLIPK